MWRAILFFGVVIVVVVLVLHLRRPSISHEPAVTKSPVPSVPESSLSKPTQMQRLGPRDIYPNPDRNPGFANPDITQENIEMTICNPHWSTRSVRPPESYTYNLKRRQIREYGYSDVKTRDYEEDHIIPLEIGGHPTDPRNLWPEPYQTSIIDGGAHYKDKVENYFHDEICSHRISLVDAQRMIAFDWYRVYVTQIAH
jgi:hypothetical protein